MSDWAKKSGRAIRHDKPESDENKKVQPDRPRLH